MSRRNKVKGTRPSPFLFRQTNILSMIFKSALTVFSIAIFFCVGCTYHQDPVKQLQNLENTDVAFSSLSKQSGMKKAFQEYMDPHAILLRPNHNPIIGDKA